MFESNTNILYRLFDQGRRFSFKLIENIIQVVIEGVSSEYSGQARSKQLKPQSTPVTSKFDAVKLSAYFKVTVIYAIPKRPLSSTFIIEKAHYYLHQN